PRGVNSWMRELRSRRYHRYELEDVIRDDLAPANKREAAMRLLLPFYESEPPAPADARQASWLAKEMAAWSNDELRWHLVDPRTEADERAAAHLVLSQRQALGPPPDRLMFMHRRPK